MSAALDPYLVGPEATVLEVMAVIDRNAKGIALVADERRCLLGTVTDGDVRRALLHQQDLGEPIRELLRRKAGEGDPETPVTAPAGTPAGELIRRMNEASVRHLPLVDGSNRVTDLAILADLVKEYELPLTAVVMAGGFGRRLRPLTDETPKPMLPVGGRPVLEHIIGQLRASGIQHVSLTTHFRAEKIAEHFGDGSDFGIDIGYVTEDEPLGTAGALSLLEGADGPLLVMNGDVLTRIDFTAMHAFHAEHNATLTIAVKAEQVEVPYGVVETDGALVREIREKPVLRHFINAGIYIVDPSARRFLTPGERLDMPQLVERLLAAGEPVASFPVHEYWIDIGHAEAYRQAELDHETGRL